MSEEPQVASARHRAREVALQALYALDLLQSASGRAAEPAAASEVPKERSRARKPLTKAARPPIRRAQDRDAAAAVVEPVVSPPPQRPPPTPLEVFEGVAENFEMPESARAFALELVELTHTDTPAAVILDEAVQLAGRYGSDTSPAFVNGILDAVARVVREPVA